MFDRHTARSQRRSDLDTFDVTAAEEHDRHTAGLIDASAADELELVCEVAKGSRNGVQLPEERFKGAEAELEYEWAPSWKTQLGYSYHDSRFVDFIKEFDPGVPTQLGGKRLEMTPFNLFGAGLLFSPANGLNANVLANYVGSRWLNMRNTAPAKAYTTWSAGLGYRMSRGEIRIDGHNLNNVRPAIAESELGDAQYYLLPARSIDVSYRWFF